MKKTYITITGTRYRHGSDFMEPGMLLRLVKEPGNEHDREAIRAEMPGFGLVGYVANSVHTVVGESMSAGRLYDRIGAKAIARVVRGLDGGVLCEVARSSILWEPPAEEDDWADLDAAEFDSAQAQAEGEGAGHV